MKSFPGLKVQNSNEKGLCVICLGESQFGALAMNVLQKLHGKIRLYNGTRDSIFNDDSMLP